MQPTQMLPTEENHEIDALLARARSDEPGALEELFRVLYRDLHARAHRFMGDHAGHTLQPTALVSEAYMRICGADGRWSSREHFILSASRAMRHVLVDHYRRKHSTKRDGGRVDVEIDHLAQTFEERSGDLIRLDAALLKLEDRDATMARVVEMRFFGGASMAEIAKVVDVPQRTLERRWNTTKSWIYSQVNDD